jgi:hypothetical protein
MAPHKGPNLHFRPNLKSSSFLSRMVSVKNALCICTCHSAASRARRRMMTCMTHSRRHQAYARTATDSTFLRELATVVADLTAVILPRTLHRTRETRTQAGKHFHFCRTTILVKSFNIWVFGFWTQLGFCFSGFGRSWIFGFWVMGAVGFLVSPSEKLSSRCLRSRQVLGYESSPVRDKF